MNPETHAGVEIMITTPAFRRGQDAARKDFLTDPYAEPNRDLLGRVSPEFRLGYLDEWENFLVPTRDPEPGD